MSNNDLDIKDNIEDPTYVFKDLVLSGLTDGTVKEMIVGYNKQQQGFRYGIKIEVTSGEVVVISFKDFEWNVLDEDGFMSQEDS